MAISLIFLCDIVLPWEGSSCILVEFGRLRGSMLELMFYLSYSILILMTGTSFLSGLFDIFL